MSVNLDPEAIDRDGVHWLRRRTGPPRRCVLAVETGTPDEVPRGYEYVLKWRLRAFSTRARRIRPLQALVASSKGLPRTHLTSRPSPPPGRRVGPGGPGCAHGAASATSSISHSRPSAPGAPRSLRDDSQPVQRLSLRTSVSTRQAYGMPRTFDKPAEPLAWPPRIVRWPTAARGCQGSSRILPTAGAPGDSARNAPDPPRRPSCTTIR